MATKPKPLAQRILETCERFREVDRNGGWITTDGIAQRISVGAAKVSARAGELAKKGKLSTRMRSGELFYRAVT